MGGKILVGGVEPSCDQDFHIYPSDPEVAKFQLKFLHFARKKKKKTKMNALKEVGDAGYPYIYIYI